MSIRNSRRLSEALLKKNSEQAKAKDRILQAHTVDMKKNSQARFPYTPNSNPELETSSELAQPFKAILEQEYLIGHRDRLSFESINKILTTIQTLERKKPLANRLNPSEITFMALTVLKKNLTGDRLKAVLREIKELEINLELKQTIKSQMKSESSPPNSIQELCKPSVIEMEYEKIMENEVARMAKPTLSGHKATVTSVVVSSDGQFIISASEDSSIKIWSIHERKEAFQLIGHSGYVWSVAISTDGTFIASGSGDKTIKIWNFKNRQEEFSLEGHSDYVRTVAISNNSQFIVSGSGDSSIKVWSIEDYSEICTLSGHDACVQAVAISSNCDYIISGSDDATVKIWNIREQRLECDLKGHTSSVNFVAMSPENDFIVSGSYDTTIMIWNIVEQKAVHTFKGHTDPVWSICLSPDGRFIVSGSGDKSIKVWNIKDHSKQEFTLKGHTGQVHSVTVSPDSRFIVSGSEDNTIRIWDFHEPREDCTLTGHQKSVSSVAVTSDSKFIVSGSQDHTIIIWNIQEQRIESTLEGHEGSVLSVAISPDGRSIISGSDDTTIRSWSIGDRREEFILPGHTASVNCVVASPDGRYIVSGSADHTVRMWSILEKKEEWKLQEDTDVILVLAISPDSSLLVIGSRDKRIIVWDMKQRKIAYKLEGHTDAIRSVVVSPDCRVIVSGSNDGTIRIWNIIERREECVINSNHAVIRCVAVSPDCRFLISAQDKCIVIWNMQEQRQECILAAHKENIQSVFISPDGRFIVSGAYDKTVRVYNIQESKRGCTRTDLVATTPDGRVIARAALDNTICVWDIEKQRQLCVLNDTENAQRICLSSDGKYIISKSIHNKVKIWNVKKQKREAFALKQHRELLNLILPMSSLSNYERTCEVFATPDCLVLGSAFKIIEIILIDNSDLQFTYDLGLYLTKEIFSDYNFSHYASADESVIIPLEVVNSYFGIFRFTLAHFYSYNGKQPSLEKLVKNPNFFLQADAFYKSPFYYAISKKRQDCIDVLLDRLEIMRTQNPENYKISIFAIRNDIPMIIKNSPRQLHLLLGGLIVSRSQIYAKVSEKLPILQVSFIPNPAIGDFTQSGTEEIPISLQHSMLPLIGETGCCHNIALLDSIINCRNSQALRSPLIQYIVKLQFNAILRWVVAYSVLLCANLILLTILIGLRSFNSYLVLLYLLVNALLFSWECVQVATYTKEYLSDFWNYVDALRSLVSVTWTFMEFYGWNSVYFTWTVAAINLMRGITVFWLLDGTRFYIVLIYRSLNEIKYFFLMFAYSTFTFGFLLMISRGQDLSFVSLWGQSYDLIFGIYGGSDSEVYFIEYAAYFAATLINIVLMLNLLISILGDSYDRFQLEEAIIDIKVKSQISWEYQSMIFWANKQSLLKYIRLCHRAFQDYQDQDWEGKIRFIENKLDMNIKEVAQGNKSIRKKIKEIRVLMKDKAEIDGSGISLDIQENLVRSNSELQTTLESKINGITATLEEKWIETNSILKLEDKISQGNELLKNSLEEKITQSNELVMSLLENKISVSNETMMMLMEAKINESNESTSSKIKEIDQKLDLILNFYGVK